MKIKRIHLQALFFSIVYFIFSNGVFVWLVTNSNIYISNLGPFVFGTTLSLIFLYVFNHKDFFPFFRNFEVGEQKKERGYLSHFLKYGKFVACILINQIGGPMFLALSIRVLFPKSKYKYLLALISSIFVTMFGMLLAKGVLSFF